MKVLGLTPPLCQLNSPYPAIGFLLGFLQQKFPAIECAQLDLGIELVWKLFSQKGLTGAIAANPTVANLLFPYVTVIDSLMDFLAGKDLTSAYRIVQDDYLPRKERFRAIQNVDHYFGAMGLHDRAIFYGTLYLEELVDILQKHVCQHFGFSRYG